MNGSPGSTERVLSDLGVRIRRRFSPVSNWVAFYSARSGAGSIWRVPAAGGPEERVTADQSQIQIVGGSPDVQAIHFVDQTGLKAVSVADGRVRSTMSFKGRHGTFVPTSGSSVSRDSRFVYFIWREDQGRLRNTAVT